MNMSYLFQIAVLVIQVRWVLAFFCWCVVSLLLGAVVCSYALGPLARQSGLRDWMLCSAVVGLILLCGAGAHFRLYTVQW